MYLSTVLIIHGIPWNTICILGVIWAHLYTELEKVNHHNAFVYTTDFGYTNFR